MRVARRRFLHEHENMVSSEQLAAWKDMDMKIGGTDLQIPQCGSPVRHLPDGSFMIEGKHERDEDARYVDRSDRPRSGRRNHNHRCRHVHLPEDHLEGEVQNDLHHGMNSVGGIPKGMGWCGRSLIKATN